MVTTKTRFDHTRAFVPVESWCFGSPELIARGIQVDIGLLAEALIYYEQVILNVANEAQFAFILEWFIRQDRYEQLLALVRDNIIQVYDYSFFTTAVWDANKKIHTLWNMQTELQKRLGSFEQRYLYHPLVENLLTKSRQRKRLYQAFRGKVIEGKADEFSEAIEIARCDFESPQRNAIIVQSFLNELYKIKHLGRPPEIAAKVQKNPDGTHTLSLDNVVMDELSEIAGQTFGYHETPLSGSHEHNQLSAVAFTTSGWHVAQPLLGGAVSNRHLLAASKLNCDLFLSRPMSALVGDKLYESTKAVNKSTTVIENLKTSVEFPDVRVLVNEGRLGFDDIMLLRSKAGRFRGWLQTEAERDRDAIIAYHHEVSKETRLTGFGRRTLDLFGFIGGGAIGGAAGASLAGPTGAAIGGAVGGAISYLSAIGSKIGAEWSPVVFGDWMRDRISQLDKGKD